MHHLDSIESGMSGGRGSISDDDNYVFINLCYTMFPLLPLSNEASDFYFMLSIYECGYLSFICTGSTGVC